MIPSASETTDRRNPKPYRLVRWELYRRYKILYKDKREPKPVEFRGSSLRDLLGFPTQARRSVGYQLDKVQRGLDPDDWKPMPSIGAGVNEIRVHDENGAFRIIYVAKFLSAVYVLHCFQKKTQKTAKSDLEIAKDRFRTLKREIER